MPYRNYPYTCGQVFYFILFSCNFQVLFKHCLVLLRTLQVSLKLIVQFKHISRVWSTCTNPVYEPLPSRFWDRKYCRTQVWYLLLREELNNLMPTAMTFCPGRRHYRNKIFKFCWNYAYLWAGGSHQSVRHDFIEIKDFTL